MTYLAEDVSELDVSELLDHARQMTRLGIFCKINSMVANCDGATRLADWR